MVAAAESRSEHPLGKAIVAYAKMEDISILDAKGFRMEAGKGIYANVSGRDLYCGSEKYLRENAICIPQQVSDTLDILRNQGKASILAAADGICVGVIGLSDVLRSTARDMVAELDEMGTQTVLLTGDNRKTADYFAKKVGITSVRAELLPEEK
ncbi:MAG: HAD family hydrolase, partial [Syntrophomonas sp.]|nr:HAD family hydrolase [Syntrophomonas sp.]